MKLSSAVRTLIALLLCLLLPLQAGATLARAASMARHGVALTHTNIAAAGTASATPASTQLAHGDHAGHADHVSHAGHDAHAGHEAQIGHADAHAGPAGAPSHHDHAVPGKHHHPTLKDPATDGKPSSHKAVHAKAGCADCAKCCLLAASAPPPMLAASFAPRVARASFEPQRAIDPAFLTDGPDRPPRHLTA